MAIGLRVAASQRLVSGPETTITALAKLEQVLPAPLRRRVTALADAVQPAGHQRRAPRSRARCWANSRSPAATTSACASPTPPHPARSRGGASSRTPSLPPTGTGICCAGTSSGTTGAPSASTGWRMSSTRACCSSRHPLTAGADRGVHPRRAVVGATGGRGRCRHGPAARRRCASAFGQWGQGAEAEDDDRTRWPVGGADFRETMYGLVVDPRGRRVHDRPRRARARRTARSAGADAARAGRRSPPPARPAPAAGRCGRAREPTHSETPVTLLTFVGGRG